VEVPEVCSLLRQLLLEEFARFNQELNVKSETLQGISV
jgi:hypothetical protein